MPQFLNWGVLTKNHVSSSMIKIRSIGKLRQCSVILCVKVKTQTLSSRIESWNTPMPFNCALQLVYGIRCRTLTIQRHSASCTAKSTECQNCGLELNGSMKATHILETSSPPSSPCLYARQLIRAGSNQRCYWLMRRNLNLAFTRWVKTVNEG